MNFSYCLLPCIALGLLSCRTKRNDAPPEVSASAREEGRLFMVKRQEELDLMKKAASDSLPEGWVLAPTDQFDLRQNPSNDRIEISAEVTQITFLYHADPTTLMVEEGQRETEFARDSFISEILFPRSNRVEIPPRLKYPGKNPPPTVEELMAGKTFVEVRQGTMLFQLQVEIKRAAGKVDCKVIDGPRPKGLQPTNFSIYPLAKAKLGTYCHGVLSPDMGIEKSQLTRTLVAEAKEKRNAELIADGVDREAERNRIAELYQLGN